jgi:hypothetical protein
MSKFNKTSNARATDVVGSLMANIGVAMANGGSQITNTTVGSHLTASVESLDTASLGNLRDASAFATQALNAAVSDTASGLGVEGLDVLPHQLEAGMIAMLAAGNPKAYHQKAIAGSTFRGNVSIEGVSIIEPMFSGAAGALDYAEAHPSLEAYDQTELNNHQGFSVTWNIQAARQSDFAETFFKTSVHTPDQTGVELTVDNIYVMNEIRHNLNGKTVDFKRQNLIRAVSDYSILSAETTRIYPAFIPTGGNQNTAVFVAAGDVPSHTVNVAGVEYATAPLKIGANLNLLGLAQHPGLLQNGVVEQSDALDSRLAIDAVYLKFVPGVGDTKVVRIPTSRLPRTAFVKSAEGNQRELALQFSSRQLTLNLATKAIDETNVTGLAAITAGGNKVKLNITLSGSADVQTGNVQVLAANLAVDKLLDADNKPVDFSSGAGAILIAGLGTITVIGYDLEARLTNSNRRSRGILLDTNQWKEQYKVYLGAPITCQKPIGSDTGAAELSALIAATRIRNDNNAITTLLNNVAQLKAVADTFGNQDEEPNIEGIGRMVIKPYFDEIALDVAAEVNSIMTHQRDADIRELFGNVLRRAAYDMLYQTQYQPALEMVSGGTSSKPHVVIGTDPVIHKYLYTSGDSRLFGDAFDFTTVSNIDKRLEGKVFMTFTRKDVNGLDPLSYGSFIWIPELATTIEMTRNGQASREIGVQPRTLHLITCPVMTVITVTNLKEATNDKTAAP